MAKKFCQLRRSHHYNMQKQQQLKHQKIQQHRHHHQQEQQIQPPQRPNLVKEVSEPAMNENKTEDPIPPHEGALKDPAQQSISIEQLFEDTYSLPVSKTPHHSCFDVSHPVACVTSCNGLGIRGSKTLPSSRVLAAQRRLAKLQQCQCHISISSNRGGCSTDGQRAVVCRTGTNSSTSKPPYSSSTSVDPPLTKKTSSIPILSSSTASNSNSKKPSDVDGLPSPRQTLRGSYQLRTASSASGGDTFVPQTGSDASKNHPSRLTDMEKAEVKVFKTVYYLGQLSAKMAAHEAGAKNEGFDDADGFYVCKPQDHLLYRYEIQELLGKGTFGQVVKALDHKTNSLVAMKIVKNERSFLRQAKEEVRILEVLRKQDKYDVANIVHILDSFKFRGHVCISFELLGISLHQMLKKTRGQGFSLTKVQNIARGILRCLEVLAKNRIIHCDIKPENILLRRSAAGMSAVAGTTFNENSIKVIDFGSSCYEHQQIYTYIQSRYYRAPEVILGCRYTCAIDIWSLACVIGELFTGQPFFAGESESDQLAAIMEIRGVPSPAMIGRCKRADKFFLGQTPRYLNSPSKKTKRQPPGSVTISSALRDTEDVMFLDFMQKVLDLDPNTRLTAPRALLHPWILGGQSSGKDIRRMAYTGSAYRSRVQTAERAGAIRSESLQGNNHLSKISGHKVTKANTVSSKMPAHVIKPLSDRPTTQSLVAAKTRADKTTGLPS